MYLYGYKTFKWALIIIIIIIIVSLMKLVIGSAWSGILERWGLGEVCKGIELVSRPIDLQPKINHL